MPVLLINCQGNAKALQEIVIQKAPNSFTPLLSSLSSVLPMYHPTFYFPSVCSINGMVGETTKRKNNEWRATHAMVSIRNSY